LAASAWSWAASAVFGYSYWSWGLLMRAQSDKRTEKHKLEQALALFTELKMPRERGWVQAELDKMDS